MQNISNDTNSDTQTKLMAEKFAGNLKGGEVICLYGDLGYGKTTFMQGLAKGLGVERKVISPTFIIMRSYELSIKHEVSSMKYLYHVDLYRINSEQEIIDIGLLDIMKKPENIVAIEWPEKIGKLMPKTRIDVTFDYIHENERKISIKYIDMSI